MFMVKSFSFLRGIPIWATIFHGDQAPVEVPDASPTAAAQKKSGGTSRERDAKHQGKGNVALKKMIIFLKWHISKKLGGKENVALTL